MRLLVVEDEEPLAASMQRGLRASGFAVDIASNGIEGLWMASASTYDAIVLDLMLPGLNGYRLCRQLRERENWAPILVLTAKVGDLDETEALDTGADDFLRKPFAHDVLVARLRALLRRGRSPCPVVMQAGDLRLDEVRRRCWRNDIEIELTTREFSILELLLRNRDVVLSKGAIIDHVWDSAFDGDPSVVEVYIHRLRAKIDQPFYRAAIETVRGAGYRLVESGG